MKLNYDVIVVGAGHAGCEAAHAAATMGARTLLVTIDMNKIAQMSCNPAVGGIAKGQIVREVDALGGAMGLVTDEAAIQFRMLNMSKGPAMWSPRAQCDRERFIWSWRTVLDNTPNLDILQDEVVEVLYEHLNSEELRVISGVRTMWGYEISAASVVITAGTFLNGLMHIGRRMVEGGRCAEPAAKLLTESICSLGIRTARMKTGTPVRIDRRSVHFEDTTIQPGEERQSMFSFMGEGLPAGQSAFHNIYGGNAKNTDNAENGAPFSNNSHALRTAGFPSSVQHDKILLPCWTFDTTPECHEILRSGLADSPLYNGQIQSIGPRYCPSIETKLVTFADKDHHPLFLEPEGENTNEMYLNGFSSSLSIDIQLRALRAIPALRDVKVYRPGYAIEYDFFDPTQLRHTLESKMCHGLFFAGQVNGTTGYEEAAGQGIVAGINAAITAGHHGAGSTGSRQADFTLHRDEAYIGVLIDDLVTKGVDEPYRMFTSRAEYRILLRQDDADRRLTRRGYELGLATRQRLDHFTEKQDAIDRMVNFCDNTSVKPRFINQALEEAGLPTLSGGVKVSDLLARPGVTMQWLANHDDRLAQQLNACGQRRKEVLLGAETYLKYRGYIDRERQEADKMHRLEDIRIKGHFNYAEINALSTEARQKLTAIDPETLAQASRIPGVSPSDVSVLLVMMKR